MSVWMDERNLRAHKWQLHQDRQLGGVLHMSWWYTCAPVDHQPAPSPLSTLTESHRVLPLHLDRTTTNLQTDQRPRGTCPSQYPPATTFPSNPFDALVLSTDFTSSSHFVCVLRSSFIWGILTSADFIIAFILICLFWLVSPSLPYQKERLRPSLRVRTHHFRRQSITPLDTLNQNKPLALFPKSSNICLELTPQVNTHSPISLWLYCHFQIWLPLIESKSRRAVTVWHCL